MLEGKYYKDKASSILALVLAIFLLCFIVVVPAYIGDGLATRVNQMPSGKESYHPVQARYSIALMPENQSSSQNSRFFEEEARPLLSLNRIMIYAYLKQANSLTAILLLSSYLVIVITKKKSTSKIALRLGGHSPPIHCIDLVL